jgi:hypothetical protein
MTEKLKGKRLFLVKIEQISLVVIAAKDESSAYSFADMNCYKIINDERPDVNITALREVKDISAARYADWDEGCYIYGTEEDTTLGEALAEIKERK